MRNEPVVRVGIGVFVLKDGQFLMGQRRNSHGHGSWSLPGGHQEFGESPTETASREVKEEADISIKNVRLGAVTNDFFEAEGKHYITLWMLSEFESGIPTVMEPDKLTGQWEWRDFDSLPQPLVLPWDQLLESEYMPMLREQLKQSRYA